MVVLLAQLQLFQGRFEGVFGCFLGYFHCDCFFGQPVAPVVGRKPVRKTVVLSAVFAVGVKFTVAFFASFERAP